MNGWTAVGMCDPIACYPYGAGTYSFDLNPGQTGIMYIDMKADITAASGTSYVTLTTNYGEMVFKFISAPPSCTAGFYIYEDSLAAPHTYIGINTCLGNIVSYDWSWGDGTPNSSGPYPSHTYAAAGVYNICVIVSDNLNCTDTFCSSENVNKTASSWYTVTFNNPNSVIEKTKENIHLYPNPAKDILSITGEILVQYHVEIFDVNGVKVQTSSFATAKNLDINTLAGGLYFIKINEGASTTRYMKFLKQ